MAPAQLPHATASADDLTRALNDIVATIDQARSVGLPVEVPEQLYRACIEIIARHKGVGPPSGTGARSSSHPVSPSTSEEASSYTHTAPSQALPTLNRASVHDIPLRRLVWQVLDPGEEVTVSEVVRRLAAMGVHPQPSAVSNALGYWVSRQRLARKRKGVYLYPTVVEPAKKTYPEGASRESPGGERAASRRKENAVGVLEDKRKAM